MRVDQVNNTERTSITYQFYNYVTRKFDLYEGHMHEVTLEYARDHVPQAPNAQTEIDVLLSKGKMPGECLLLALSRYT